MFKSLAFPSPTSSNLHYENLQRPNSFLEYRQLKVDRVDPLAGVVSTVYRYTRPHQPHLGGGRQCWFFVSAKIRMKKHDDYWGKRNFISVAWFTVVQWANWHAITLGCINDTDHVRYGRVDKLKCKSCCTSWSNLRFFLKAGVWCYHDCWRLESVRYMACSS